MSIQRWPLAKKLAWYVVVASLPFGIVALAVYHALKRKGPR
jgi:hypothetical protein